MAAEETKEPKAFAGLEPLLTYGVKPDVHGGLYFTKTDTVIYPSGCGISLYSAKEKKQELVPLADKGKHLSAIGNYMHMFKFAIIVLHIVEKREKRVILFHRKICEVNSLLSNFFSKARCCLHEIAKIMW